MRNAYKFVIGRHEGKNHPERPRCRWEDNIKMVFKETGEDGVVWIHLDHYVMNLPFHKR
jgi:hypothetical protein